MATTNYNLMNLMVSSYDSELDELAAQDTREADRRIEAATSGLADILTDLGIGD